MRCVFSQAVLGIPFVEPVDFFYSFSNMRRMCIMHGTELKGTLCLVNEDSHISINCSNLLVRIYRKSFFLSEDYYV
jgi:hypothetical protein